MAILFRPQWVNGATALLIYGARATAGPGKVMSGESGGLIT